MVCTKPFVAGISCRDMGISFLRFHARLPAETQANCKNFTRHWDEAMFHSKRCDGGDRKSYTLQMANDKNSQQVFAEKWKKWKTKLKNLTNERLHLWKFLPRLQKCGLSQLEAWKVDNACPGFEALRSKLWRSTCFHVTGLHRFSLYWLLSCICFYDCPLLSLSICFHFLLVMPARIVFFHYLSFFACCVCLRSHYILCFCLQYLPT